MHPTYTKNSIKSDAKQNAITTKNKQTYTNTNEKKNTHMCN